MNIKMNKARLLLLLHLFFPFTFSEDLQFAMLTNVLC